MQTWESTQEESGAEMQTWESTQVSQHSLKFFHVLLKNEELYCLSPLLPFLSRHLMM